MVSTAGEQPFIFLQVLIGNIGLFNLQKNFLFVICMCSSLFTWCTSYFIFEIKLLHFGSYKSSVDSNFFSWLTLFFYHYWIILESFTWWTSCLCVFWQSFICCYGCHFCCSSCIFFLFPAVRMWDSFLGTVLVGTGSPSYLSSGFDSFWLFVHFHVDQSSKNEDGRAIGFWHPVNCTGSGVVPEL